MALGGGFFVTQNKKLPGAYINFVGTKRVAGNLSDRGTAAVALSLSWGELGKIVSVSREDISKKCKRLFGVSYNDASMMPIRELFCNATKLLVYRLGTGGTAAENTYASAAHPGVIGNQLITTIAATTNGSEQNGWTVETYLGGDLVDTQTVYGNNLKTDVLEDNDFVSWKPGVALAETTKTTGALRGGGDPDAVTSHGSFLSALQNVAFNVVACSSTDETIKAEYAAFIQDLRDNCGIKAQAVIYKFVGDYEGVINAVNKIEGEPVGEESGSIVYWVAGAEAGIPVNRSCTNMTYNGELLVDTDYDQEDLENALTSGQLILHRVGNDIRVLEDINSLTTLTETKTDDFRYNQTIRVLDQLGNDIAMMYNNRYIGKIPNDADGRVTLWSDIVSLCNTLLDMRAIENFVADDIEVLPGDTKRAVVCNMKVTPVNAMAQLYCTIYVN